MSVSCLEVGVGVGAKKIRDTATLVLLYRCLGCNILNYWRREPNFISLQIRFRYKDACYYKFDYIVTCKQNEIEVKQNSEIRGAFPKIVWS